MKSGFSLVELSIVLVILGLLTGGILAGQSLIRAAELRAVATEYSRYIASVQTFRDKYFAIPGDFRDATKFWGRQNATAGCVTNSAAAVATPGACDGNGNGLIDSAVGAGVASDMYQFWRHLSLAGLIEGSYTGLSGSNTYDCPLTTVCPKSRLGNAGWFARGSDYTIPVYAGDGTRYSGTYGNTLEFGGYVAEDTLSGRVLKAEEAWNIDTKMDDGKPGTGKIIPRYWGVCDTATANNDYAGNYALSTSNVSCMLYFLKAY